MAEGSQMLFLSLVIVFLLFALGLVALVTRTDRGPSHPADFGLGLTLSPMSVARRPMSRSKWPTRLGAASRVAEAVQESDVQFSVQSLDPAGDGAAGRARWLARATGATHHWLPRRGWVPAAAIGALVMAATAMLALRGGPDEGSRGTTTLSKPAAQSSVVQQQATTPSVAPTRQQRPATVGSPFSEASLTTALRSRGFGAARVDEAPVCENASAVPTTFQVMAAGAEERIALLVYPSPTAMRSDWAIDGGGPLRFHNGACFAGAAVIYWNQNLVLVFLQTTSAPLRQQIADAFLTLTP